MVGRVAASATRPTSSRWQQKRHQQLSDSFSGHEPILWLPVDTSDRMTSSAEQELVKKQKQYRKSKAESVETATLEQNGSASAERKSKKKRKLQDGNAPAVAVTESGLNSDQPPEGAAAGKKKKGKARDANESAPDSKREDAVASQPAAPAKKNKKDKKSSGASENAELQAEKNDACEAVETTNNAPKKKSRKKVKHAIPSHAAAAEPMEEKRAAKKAGKKKRKAAELDEAVKTKQEDAGQAAEGTKRKKRKVLDAAAEPDTANGAVVLDSDQATDKPKTKKKKNKVNAKVDVGEAVAAVQAEEQQQGKLYTNGTLDDSAGAQDEKMKDAGNATGDDHFTFKALPNEDTRQQQAEKRKASQAFQRVKADEWLDKAGAWDNSYEAQMGQDGWGYKAQLVLGQTRGKGFRHEKTKKKRGSYRGGLIDTNAVKSFKFDSDEE